MCLMLSRCFFVKSCVLLCFVCLTFVFFNFWKALDYLIYLSLFVRFRKNCILEMFLVSVHLFVSNFCSFTPPIRSALFASKRNILFVLRFSCFSNLLVHNLGVLMKVCFFHFLFCVLF